MPTITPDQKKKFVNGLLWVLAFVAMMLTCVGGVLWMIFRGALGGG